MLFNRISLLLPFKSSCTIFQLLKHYHLLNTVCVGGGVKWHCPRCSTQYYRRTNKDWLSESLCTLQLSSSGPPPNPERLLDPQLSHPLRKSKRVVSLLSQPSGRFHMTPLLIYVSQILVTVDWERSPADRVLAWHAQPGFHP